MQAHQEKAANDSGRDRVLVWSLLFLLVVTFLVARLPLISLPLTRDEGEYAYVAQRFSEGDIPYRDAFDQKPPGIFLAYSLAFSLFGESAESIRILKLIWEVVSAATLFLLARRLAGSLVGILTSLGLVISTAATTVVGYVANTEIFMLLPMVGSVLFMLRGFDGGKGRDWVICGALAMCAVWFKQVAATNVLFILASVLWVALRDGDVKRWRCLSRRLVWLFLGALLVSLPVCIYFSVHEAFQEFLDAVFLHNFVYASSKNIDHGLYALGKMLAWQLPQFWPLWSLAVIGLLIPLSGRADFAKARRLSFVWWLFLLLGVSLGFYFRPHYFIQMLPALSLLAGVGAARIVNQIPRSRNSGRVVVGLFLGLLLTVPALHAQRDVLLEEAPDRQSRMVHGMNPFFESVEIARRIQAGSTEGETVFIFGSEPQIFFYSGRRSATRYIFTYPLLGGFEDSSKRQQEAIREVREARPRYVVVVSIQQSHLEDPAADHSLENEVEQLLGRGYILETIAVPTDHEGSFSFYDEMRAQKVSQDVLAMPVSPPTIRVYRRQD